MIQLDQLTKHFGAVRALDNLSLEVKEGVVYGLIGPNGAGKTTAMNILATLLLPDTGTARVGGRDVVQEPRVVRQLIGYMQDFFGVYDGLRASEYLDFFAAAYRIPVARRSQLIQDLLELVNLPDKGEVYVDTLSRGMKQRLALARCLVHDPPVLILDEPASGLDPRARAELKEIIRQLKHLNKTVLISSHILPELAEMCDEVAILDHGRLVTCGPVEEITRVSQGSRYLKVEVIERAQELVAFLNSQPAVSGVRVEGLSVKFFHLGDPVQQAQLLQNLVTAGWPVLEFGEVRRNLEEAFMAVTGEEGGVEDGA
ncbi:MAG: ABC transporter ATP-binding protein [Syntrophomonadaceae bacterium]|nr:ABC transporter ATP-binding protein [Syntrophomonadaceae bacterium]